MLLKGSDFTPAPEGMFPAVCVDVVDLGVVDSAFGKKHKLKIVWEIDQTMENGQRFTVQKWYTASMHEKSTLAKDLKAWRGRGFSPEELKGFDPERIVGAPCQLVIVHTEKDGAVYANIQSILKAGTSKLAPSGRYIRVKDRPDQKGAPMTNGKGHQEDSAIPF